MRTYLVLVIALSTGMFASLFWKKAFLATGGITLGGSNFFAGLMKIISDWHFWVGTSFGIFAILSLFDMLSHEEMSFVAPLFGLGYVLTLLVGKFVLNEDVTLWRWAGVVLIVIGVYIVTKTR